jgi:hypothetical protein
MTATISLDSITTGQTHLPPRIIVLGTEKVGKSTFASQSDRPIMICVRGETGLDAIDAPKFPVANAHADVIARLDVLLRDKHDFGTVVIDSCSALEPLIWDHTCQTEKVASIEKVGGGFGKGFIEALTYWREITDRIDRLREQKGMASILIGHTKVKMVNNPLVDPFDAWIWDIDARAANLLYRWSDCILFATRQIFSRKVDTRGGSVTHATGGDQSRAYTRSKPHHPGGGRGVYGQLPYELPLEWNAFIEAVSNQLNANSNPNSNQN